jgi:hypothetical protein
MPRAPRRAADEIAGNEGLDLDTDELAGLVAEEAFADPHHSKRHRDIV